MRSFFRKCLLTIILLLLFLVLAAVLSQFLINHSEKNGRYFSSVISNIVKKPISFSSIELHVFSFYPEVIMHDAIFSAENNKDTLLYAKTAKITTNLLKSWEEKSWVVTKTSIENLKINIRDNNDADENATDAVIQWIQSQDAINLKKVEINNCNKNTCAPLLSFSTQLTKKSGYQKIEATSEWNDQAITITTDAQVQKGTHNWKILFNNTVIRNQTINFSGNVVVYFDLQKHFSLSAGGNGNVKNINLTGIQGNYDKNTTSFKISGIVKDNFLEQLFPGKMLVSATGNANAVNIAIRNPSIVGTVFISQQKNTPVKVVLQRMALQFNQKSSASTASDINPKDIPSLLITINDFIVNGEDLGHLSWKSTSIRNGIVLDKLKLKSPSEKILLKGSWIKENAFEKTMLSGIIKSNNFGEWFQKIHHIARIKKGKLDLQFSLETQGPPKNIFSLKSVKGKSHFKIENATIIDKDKKNKPNGFFDSMLNLISLQSISGFLTLDFSALKKTDGFKIFVLVGNMSLENGHLKSKQVVMKSAVAKIDFSGNVNLLTNQNNLIMVVYPNIIPSQPLGTCPVLFIFRFPIWIWKKISAHFLDPFFNIKYKVTGTLDKPIAKKM